MSKNNISIIDAFLSIRDHSIMDQFLKEIFTDPERKDFELRWEVMKKLRNKIPQRKIASDLGVSLCKITRGAKILKDKSSISNTILTKMSD